MLRLVVENPLMPIKPKNYYLIPRRGGYAFDIEIGGRTVGHIHCVAREHDLWCAWIDHIPWKLPPQTKAEAIKYVLLEAHKR